MPGIEEAWKLQRWLVRRVGLLVFVLSVIAVALPARASALPGPSSLGLGVIDYDAYIYSPAAQQAFWLSRAQALGSSITRLPVGWADIAYPVRPRGFKGADPRSPGYQWGALDEEVSAAVAHGQTVVLMAFDAPQWAERGAPPPGVTRGSWFPNAAAFGDFGHALAVRYSGHFPDPAHRGRKLPHVRYFQAWNEPNLPGALMPQWERTKGGTWKAVSPGTYRGLLNAFYRGVHSAQRGAVVLAAGTAPYGDPPGTAGGRMYPVTFLQGMFCLTPSLRSARCSNPPHLDAIDHHPYGLSPTTTTKRPGDIGLPDVYKIDRILTAARRYRHVLPTGPKPLWITEIDYASGTPDTPAIQARYLARAFYDLWRDNATHIMWFELRDPFANPGGASFYSSGLYYSNGVPKPAAAAFRFPFVAVPERPRKLVLWGRAPARGRVVIERLSGKRWRRVAVLGTTSGGIFYQVRKATRSSRAGEFRAVAGRSVSPTWTNG